MVDTAPRPAHRFTPRRGWVNAPLVDGPVLEVLHAGRFGATALRRP